MDYPDVTFVLQMGSTTKEQYTHRLGRTARAGKEGSGLLLCAPFEMSALQRDLRDMPLVVAEPPVLAGEVSTSHNHTSHSQSLLFTYPPQLPYSTHLTPPPLTSPSLTRSVTLVAVPVNLLRSNPSPTCSNSQNWPGGRGWGTTTANR